MKIMVQAMRSPVNLLLRRITFICSACIILYASCTDIPDQDACIEIDAEKNDERILSVDTPVVFDTILSRLGCTIRYRNGTPASNWDVSWYVDSTETIQQTDRNGKTAEFWVKEGNFSLTVGNPSEYPCIMIYNLKVPGGKACDINIALPTNE